MHHSRLLSSILIALLITTPTLAFAEESSTGSSSSTVTESDALRADRTARVKDFTDSVEKAKMLDAQFNERRATYFRKRAQSRAACRDEIRRANKTTLMKTLLTCYSAELTALQEFVGKQKDELQGTAGLTSTIRSLATTRVDLLSDAIGTVLFAIQSGVYTSQQDLMEAKHNLTQKYALPAWDTWMMARADRELTWIAQMIKDLDAMSAQETAAGMQRSELSDARSCLTTQETALRPLIKPETADRAVTLGTVIAAAQLCIGKMQSIPRALTESGSVIKQQ